MDVVLTDDILEGLRAIGDPIVDPTVRRLLVTARRKAAKDARVRLTSLLDGSNAATFKVSDLLRHDREPDPFKVNVACDLFARFGSEIAAAMLLAALPEAYAARRGAQSLLARSTLGLGGAVSARRIQATAQFVISVLTPPSSKPTIVPNKYTTPRHDVTSLLWGSPNGQALRYAVALRIMHSLIRTLPPQRAGIEVADASNLPLNQEDLLATLLTFSVTVFEVLEKFGIHWTEDEQEAYFYVWDRVGETLGIGNEKVICELTAQDSLALLHQKLREGDETEIGPNGLLGEQRNRRVLRRIVDVRTLRPQSVPEARALLARLRERMWTLKNDQPPAKQPFDYENFKEVLDDVSPGRVLLRALLDEVATQLRPGQKTWPVAVMRQLVPVRVQNRLALGGTSSLGLLSTSVGNAGDVAGLVALRRLSAEALRQRATLVADSLFLHYLNEGDLEIPGLDASVLGYGKSK